MKSTGINFRSIKRQHDRDSRSSEGRLSVYARRQPVFSRRRALPGFTLERVRFTKPVPLRTGFDRIAQILKDAGRPLTAFAACELRSPAPFTESGFVEFNEVYTGTLKAWGVLSDGAILWRAAMCVRSSIRRRSRAFMRFTYAVPAPMRRRRSSSPAVVRRRKARATIATCRSARRYQPGGDA